LRGGVLEAEGDEQLLGMLSLLSELTQPRARAKPPVSRLQPPPAGDAVPRALPAALPVARSVEAPAPRAATAKPVLVPPAPRRLGTASHLRSLTPQEVLLCLMGQLSALMDSLDGPDWTINPAYHPDVNAFIQKHGGNLHFVTKARALQRNRAPYYGKMVVPGEKRKTILSMGRATVVD